nr:IS3 family transposase [Actinoplanes globisporus]
MLGDERIDAGEGSSPALRRPGTAHRRREHSFDNALTENFWSTLKIELGYRTSWRTRDEAENAIFEYIDTWYNARRIQRELGYLSPDEYETTWHAQTAPDNLTRAPTGGR